MYFTVAEKSHVTTAEMGPMHHFPSPIQLDQCICFVLLPIAIATGHALFSDDSEIHSTRKSNVSFSACRHNAIDGGGCCIVGDQIVQFR